MANPTESACPGASPEYLALERDRLHTLVDACLAVAGGGATFLAPSEGPDGWVWALRDPAGVEASTWDRVVNTTMSPKAALLPQTEELFGWRSRQNEIQLIPAGNDAQTAPPAVLFGIRPCDAAALEVLDQALLEGPWPDEAYAAARARTLVVTWACERTGPECFCDACGLDPAAEGGDMIVLPAEADAGAVLLVRGLTEKGRAVVRHMAAGGMPAVEAAEQYERRREVLARQRTAFGARVNLGAVKGATEEESLTLFASPAWPAIAERCISCGACAYVCPTCHCFAVSDEAGFASGRRVRTWDSCGFKEHMVAAGGHNPRPTKTERVRQRFMHKLSYHRVRHGRLMCVGCGRCAQSCPVGLHIAEAAVKLLEDEVTGA